MTNYIAYKRFKGKTLNGKKINLQATSTCWSENNLIFYNDIPICTTYSQNAYDYFICNDDNMGLKRAKYISMIKNKLSKRDNNYDNRWEKIKQDSLVCYKYHRLDNENYWIWNHDFYNAPIGDLKYIAKLINLQIEEE